MYHQILTQNNNNNSNFSRFSNFENWYKTYCYKNLEDKKNMPIVKKDLVPSNLEDRLDDRQTKIEFLENNNLLLHAQQEALMDGILVIDANQQIISYNKHFEEMWHISPEKLATNDDGNLLEYMLDNVTEKEQFLSKLENFNVQSSATYYDEIYLKDGRIFDHYSAPVISPEGKYYGRIWSFRDVTLTKQAQQALLYLAEDLELRLKSRTDELNYLIIALQNEIGIRKKTETAFHNAEMRLENILNLLDTHVVWSICPDTYKLLYLSDNSEKIYHRYKQEFLDNPNLKIEVIYPDDRPQIQAYYQEIIEKGTSEIEYRIILPNGEIRWLLDRGCVVRDAQGNIMRIDGFSIDISERKYLEEKLLKILAAQQSIF